MQQNKKNKILFAIAGSRIVVSRIFGLGILVLLLFTGHSFGQETITDLLFEVSGLFLLTICTVGRLWALMYISGNKRRELITEGPYSMTRNPLYVFSLIGGIGIGLASENVLILALIVVFYLLYYPFTILAEEEKLANKFGQIYEEYKKRTPGFFPKFSLYKEPELYQVKASSFALNFLGGIWFIWIFIFMNFVEKLQDLGYLPVLLRLP